VAADNALETFSTSDFGSVPSRTLAPLGWLWLTVADRVMRSTRRHLYRIILYCNIICLQYLPYHTSRRARNNGDAFSAVNCTVYNTRALVRAKPLWHVRLIRYYNALRTAAVTHAVATLNPDSRNGFRKKFNWPNRKKKKKRKTKCALNSPPSNYVPIFGSTALYSDASLPSCDDLSHL